MLKSEYTLKGTHISKLTPGSEQTVVLVCDNCSKETTTQWSNYAKSQSKKGNTGITHCRACVSKLTSHKRRGRPAHNKGKSLPFEQRKRSPYITTDGYRAIYVPEEYAYLCKGNSGWRRYKKEHIFLMEKFLGRKLEPFEEVHHIDGNKLNNNLENLALLDSASHKGTHYSLQTIGYDLVKSGLVVFDKESSKYVAHDKLRELLEHPEKDSI